MTAHSPDSLPAPDSDENSLKTGTFRKEWDILPYPNLTDMQFRAIELTLQGHNDTQTAQLLSISPRTLWNWKNRDDDYREALTEARHQLHATVTDRYQSLIFRATAVLVKFLEDPTDTTRLKAAQILLNMASRYKPAPLPKRPQAEEEDDYFPMPVLEPKVG